MLVILGDDEVANKTVAIRDRRKREQSNVNEDEFFKIIQEKLSEDSI
jgi:threonyl-tRNA synthetase